MLPKISTREVGSFDIDDLNVGFHARARERKQMYQRLGMNSESALDSGKEDIAESIKTIVARMTENLHFLSSETILPSSSRNSVNHFSADEHNFETDETEVWGSIAAGSKILQEVFPLNSLQLIA